MTVRCQRKYCGLLWLAKMSDIPSSALSGSSPAFCCSACSMGAINWVGSLEAFNKVESTIFRCAVSTSFFSVFLLLLLRALALFPRLCKSPYTLSALIVCALSVRVYALPLPARSTLILFPWVTGSYDYDFLCLEMLWILLVWNFVCFTFCL